MRGGKGWGRAMTLTRRATILGGTAALTLASLKSMAEARSVVPTLRGAPATLRLAPDDYPATDVWACDD